MEATKECQRPDQDAFLRFVERFAMVMVDSGMPRMPARVFAFLLAQDSGSCTAGELAAGLRVSPAAISGAVRYLVQTGLVAREREPGQRSDHYRVYDDLWYELYTQRSDLLRRWENELAKGMELLGIDRPAGRRMRESQAFFAFLRSELASLGERWRERRQALLADAFEHDRA